MKRNDSKIVTMMTRTILAVTIIFSTSLCVSSNAQTDPVRAKLFTDYAKSEAKAIKSQNKQLEQMIGLHKLTSDEVKKITNYQKRYNEYLDSLKNFLTWAANIYTIFYEVDQTVKNLNELKSIVVTCPSNTMAVALSRSKNNIYNDVIDNGIQVALDVKRLLPLSEDGDRNSKMSEFERIECIERVRNDLRSMNYKIRKMCRLMRYTTLMDSWYEQKGTYRKPKSMIEICNRSQKRWTSTAKAAAKLNCK